MTERHVHLIYPKIVDCRGCLAREAEVNRLRKERDAEHAGRIMDQVLLRREWWLNHGHPFSALYGDDGEMQCHACGMDFGREPLDRLNHQVFLARAALHPEGRPDE